MFTLNPEAGKEIETKKIDAEREFSPEFEALLEKYQQENNISK